MEATVRRRLEIGFGLVILAMFLLFFVLGMTYPPNPRELPLLVDGVGIVVMIVHLVRVIRQPAVPGKKAGAPVNWRAVYLSFGTMALSVIVAYFIGMVLASAVVVYGCGMAYGGKSRVKMAILAAGTGVVVYVLFVVLLGTELYRGILFGA